MGAITCAIDKELLEVSFPLQEQFRNVAPGSHRHSQNVGSICQTIASDIGLDPDLMKFVGMYHDIGKIRCPEMFSENQSSDKNIHDEFDPVFSYYAITRHVGDGVTLLLEYSVPVEALQIISQHHGDTVLRPFYLKMGKGADECDFRYRCCKPTSAEASILMIVDSAEASVQAEFQRGNGDTSKPAVVVSKVIDAVTKRLTDDGQLDEMKVGVLKAVKKILQKELESYHHKRVVYSGVDDKTIGESKEYVTNGDGYLEGEA